jgi:hypothetical protein
MVDFTTLKPTEPTEADRWRFAAMLAARGCNAAELAFMTGTGEDAARTRLADNEFSDLAAAYRESFDRLGYHCAELLVLDQMLLHGLGYDPRHRPQ